LAHGAVIRHHFEAAHRVPVIGGKCLNLHGHSWWFEIDCRAPNMESGMVVEFGCFKDRIRSWVDDHLDHATLLNAGDPLIPALTNDGTKLYRFGAADAGPAEKLATDLEWPTSESVAHVLRLMATEALDCIEHAPDARIFRVAVMETASNAAYWEWDGDNSVS
jgi:6-pyruvoyltetrahydropterin/6-carboxytetrahydropterin synthase